MAEGCGATQPPLTKKGWVCDGTNLVMIMAEDKPLGSASVPVVIRADLVCLLDGPTASMVEAFGTAPFPGGDHVHLVLREPR